jgi:cyclic-di-GMP phosphodiesterase TipF (flagellum assembly factor)
MTQQIAMPDDTPPYNPRYGDAFVIFAVTVLSCAIGAWLVQRLGLAVWTGMGAALAVYAALLWLHLLMRRSLAAGAATTAAPPPLARRKAPPPPPPAGLPPLKSPAGETMPAGATLPLPASPAQELARWGESAPADAAKPRNEPPAPRSSTPFSFRPSREPAFPPPPPLGSGLPSTAGTPKGTDPSKQRDAAQGEISVDFVEESIKKLADALNGTGDRPPTTSERGDATEAMIGRSIEALQTAARAMNAPPGSQARWWPSREPTLPQPPPGPGFEPKAPRQSGPPPLPSAGAPPLNPQLARIVEAVAAERLEVLLEPIHALVEGRPRHFEISMRLLTADGVALEQHELSRLLQCSGLMPRIDAARIARAARVAGRLGQRGRQGSVLTTMAGESLTDASFLDRATSAPGDNAAMTLVLAFAQNEVRAFTPAHLQALAGLADLGFRFGLEAVTDLDMDFAALKQMGFLFVELDAPVFLDGLPSPGGHIPASDICRHLADFGLSLIVGRIEDDWLLARILGFGVLFGKGTRFGGPRLVKDEVTSGPAAA